VSVASARSVPGPPDAPTAELSVAGFGAQGEIGGGPVVTRENPARTAQCVGHITTTTAAGVASAIGGAETAGRDWRRRPLAERVELLRSAARAVAESADALAPVLARELGKPIADSAGEMIFAAAFIDHVCGRVGEVAADRVIDDAAGRVVVVREPFGVISAIVPWNAPLILSALKVAPALAAGNTILVKPSPIAPFAVTAALRTIAEFLPAGVLSVVHGEAEVGAAMVSHPSVRKVAFTGGASVAHEVLRGCAEMLTPATLELGGNDAAVVLEDLSFTDATMERLVFGAFLTSGQVCMAAKRLYVPEHRLGEFTEAFTAAAERVLVCGDPLDPEVTIGPVATAAQRDRVLGLVRAACSAGARSTELGRTTSAFDPDSGYFLRPTLVTGAPDESAIITEEQFGPTVPVIGYKDLDRAIAAANDTESGLASSVWSDDVELAFRVGRRLEAGMTFINSHNRSGMSLRVPFGGVKRSGFGREFGDAGIEEYLQTHALHLPGAIRDARPSAAPAGNRYPV